MKNVLISVGIPTYNNQRYIRTAIQSLRTQSYKNIEIIVSDNNSTDKTYALCNRLARFDKRIAVYRQTTNRGPADNFNFVLSKSRGEFFLWTAGDDIRDPDCIQKMAKLFNENAHCALVVSALKQFRPSREITFRAEFPKFSRSIDALRTFLHHPEYGTLMVYGMYKTNVLKKLGGYHKDLRPVFDGASEFVTAFKILLTGELGYIDTPLLYKRDSGYYLNQKDILLSGEIPQKFIVSLRRFLLFPVMFFFDLFYSLLYTLRSSVQFNEKISILIYCFDNYFIENYQFLLTITRGVSHFTYGFYKRFVLHFQSR